MHKNTIWKCLRTAVVAGGLALAAAGAHAQSFANGADISWVSQQESSGYKFYNSSGVQADPFLLLKNLQINAIRLRVWVNPADGWNGVSGALTVTEGSNGVTGPSSAPSTASGGGGAGGALAFSRCSREAPTRRPNPAA